VTETILHNFNIAAFNPIDINFMGYPTGQIDVTSNAGIIVDGPIKNTSGSINMTTNGSITQGPDEFAGITAQYLNLTAGTGIGTGNSPLNVDLVTGSWLDASTGSGDINIHAGNSSLTFDLVSAPGNVLLSADMDIAGRNNNSLVSGLMVNLNSDHGNIGSDTAPVRVNSAANENGGLKATSAGDMYITETTGDLYLINAESLGGNVELVVENGGIVDNNTYETVDERAKAELFGLWDDMQLMGDKAEESAENTVSAYERMKERDYDTYWKYRRRQADNGADYNPEYEVELTDAERERYRNLTYLENEDGTWVEKPYTEADIDALEDKMTDEYHELHVTYGAETETYEDSWTYEVAEGSDEWNTLTAGYSWTKDQLENSISVGILKEVSDTEIRIEEPNAAGNNVTLTATGMIGEDKDQVTITIAELRQKPWSELDENVPAEKAILDKILILMAAENNDIVSQTDTTITIQLREDIDVNATGSLTVNGPGNVYLGSEEDININQIISNGKIRIKGQKGIYNAAADGVENIVGSDTILEAGYNSIGASDKSLLINLDTNATLTVRSGDSIYITENSDDMHIDTVYAVKHVDLVSSGSIFDANVNGGLDIRAESLNLTAPGSVGGSEPGEMLDIGLDATGSLSGDVGFDVFISSPQHDLNTGSLRAGGNIELHGNNDIYIHSADGGIFTLLGDVSIDAYNAIFDGDVDDTHPGVTGQYLDFEVQVGGIGELENFLEIDQMSDGILDADAPLGVYILEREGDLRIGDVNSNDWYVILDAPDGSLHVGSVTAEVEANLTAAGSILDVYGTGDPNVTADIVNLIADGTIGGADDYFDVECFVNANATGDIFINEVNDEMEVGLIASSTGDVHLTAPNGSIVDGSEDDIVDIIARSITIDASGSIGEAANVLDVDTSATGILNASSATDISIVERSGDMNVGLVDSDTGTIRLTADGSIFDSSNTDAADIAAPFINLVSQNGDIGAADNYLDVASFVNAAAPGDIYINKGSPDHMDVGVITSNGGNVNLTAPGSINIFGSINSSAGDATINAGDSILDANNDAISNINAVNINLTAQTGSIGTTDNHFDIDSSNTNQGVFTATAEQDININEAQGDLYVDQITSISGDLNITVDESILDGNNNTTDHFSGSNVNLEARNGGIGDDGNRLFVNSENMLSFNLSASESIFLGEGVGDLNLNNINSINGSVDLLVSDGNAYVDHVSALEDIMMFVDGGELIIDTLESESTGLTVTGTGGILKVNDAYVSDSVKLNADDINISATHTTAVNPLHFDVSGGRGGLAHNVSILTNSEMAVIFDHFKSDYGYVDAQVDTLEFLDTVIGTRAVFNNSLYKVIVDNKDWSLQACEAQLYAPETPFSLTFSSEKRLLTDAFIVDYHNDFIMNSFSTENSFVRIDHKMNSILIYSDKPIEINNMLSSYNIQLALIEGYSVDLVYYHPNRLGIEDGESIKNEEELEVINK